MTLRTRLESIATRVGRLLPSLAGLSAPDHPANGGITGDDTPAKRQSKEQDDRSK